MPASRRSGSVFEVLKTVVIAVVIALVLRTFAYEPFNVPSGSMKPTLLVGDSVFVAKYAYGYGKASFPLGLAPFSGRILGRLPLRGDIVAFRLPSDPDTAYLKRVVGLPGDKVQLIQGLVYVNGTAARRERADDFVDDAGGFSTSVRQFTETLPGGGSHGILQPVDDGPLDHTGIFEVPADHVFVMGDNRENSQDSRVLSAVGYIPMENVVGRAEIRFFSIDPMAEWWQFWRWPGGIRFGRLFSLIH